MNKGTLIIFILSIGSSFIDNKEIDNFKFFDVIEFWITNNEAIRIKTYAVDADIHVHQWKHDDFDKTKNLAFENTFTNYGDVILEKHVLELSGDESEIEIINKLDSINLKGSIEFKSFPFWNPDGRQYKTVSKP